jgi:hypothetical protein
LVVWVNSAKSLEALRDPLSSLSIVMDSLLSVQNREDLHEFWKIRPDAARHLPHDKKVYLPKYYVKDDRDLQR